MRKVEVVLWLLVAFFSGMVVEGMMDLHEIRMSKPKPTIQKKWEAPKTPFRGLERV